MISRRSFSGVANLMVQLDQSAPKSGNFWHLQMLSIAFTQPPDKAAACSVFHNVRFSGLDVELYDGGHGNLDAHESVRNPCLTFPPLKAPRRRKYRKFNMRAVQVAFILIGVTALAYWFLAGPEEQASQIPSKPNPAIVEVVIPETLSANAQIGKAAFEEVCASCHGVNAVGQLEVAPPLVHVIYEPSHHGDEAFQRAVANGVRAHHWPFGSMPPVEGLTRGDVQMIVAYVREMQRANGIE